MLHVKAICLHSIWSPVQFRGDYTTCDVLFWPFSDSLHAIPTAKSHLLPGTVRKWNPKENLAVSRPGFVEPHAEFRGADPAPPREVKVRTGPAAAASARQGPPHSSAASGKSHQLGGQHRPLFSFPQSPESRPGSANGSKRWACRDRRPATVLKHPHAWIIWNAKPFKETKRQEKTLLRWTIYELLVIMHSWVSNTNSL